MLGGGTVALYALARRAEGYQASTGAAGAPAVTAQQQQALLAQLRSDVTYFTLAGYTPQEPFPWKWDVTPIVPFVRPHGDKASGSERAAADSWYKQQPRGAMSDQVKIAITHINDFSNALEWAAKCKRDASGVPVGGEDAAMVRQDEAIMARVAQMLPAVIVQRWPTATPAEQAEIFIRAYKETNTQVRNLALKKIIAIVPALVAAAITGGVAAAGAAAQFGTTTGAVFGSLSTTLPAGLGAMGTTLAANKALANVQNESQLLAAMEQAFAEMKSILAAPIASGPLDSVSRLLFGGLFQ